LNVFSGKRSENETSLSGLQNDDTATEFNNGFKAQSMMGMIQKIAESQRNNGSH